MAKKVLLIVFGAIAALIGLGLAIGGFVLLALTGGDGYFGSGTETLRTPTYALISESAAIDAGTGADGFAATVRIRAASLTGEEVFLGIGPAVEVDRYLTGVPHDEVRDIRFSPFRYDVVRWDGERSPPPPGDQPLWTSRAAGPGEQTLEFRIDSGDYRLVVMNADASPGVQVRTSFGLRAPFLRPLGIGLAIGGVLATVAGLLLLVWGVRTKVPPRQPAWGAYGGQPGYGYPPGYGGQPGYGGPPAYGPPGYGQPPGYGPGGPAPPAGYPGPGGGQPGWPAGAGEPGQAGWGEAGPGEQRLSDPTAPSRPASEPTASDLDRDRGDTVELRGEPGEQGGPDAGRHRPGTDPDERRGRPAD